MTRATRNAVKGLLVAVAAIVAVPSFAMADRDDRDRNRVAPRTHYYDRAPERDRSSDRGRSDYRGGSSSSGSVHIDVRTGGTICESPVLMDRATQVWVEPVYRTVCDKVWVEPVYRSVCEKVWVMPVVEKRVERVWVPERRELRSVWRGRVMTQEWVCVAGHYEDVSRDVVVVAGHYEDVPKQVLVREGYWQNVERQELVCAGHWETRVDRVAMAQPAVREGFHFGLRW